MNQNSVDDLLAKVQADADAVKAAADGGVSGAAAADATAALAGAAESVSEIAGEMEAPDPQPAEAPVEQGMGAESFTPAPAAISQHGKDFRRLLEIEVPVIVQLGVRRLTVGEVMRLAVGAIVEFGKSAEEEMDLLANNKAIGKGHAVKVGENFGIKITSIGSVKETIRKLGGA
jgi:flagellar motor switch protein FliN/FliY